MRQPGDPGHQGAQDEALRDEHPAGVNPFRRPERADRVADRLDPGQRRAAVGERAEQGKDHGRADQALGAGADRVGAVQGVRVVAAQVTDDLPDQAHRDHQQHRAGEQVGRYRERPARLPEAAQVPEAQQQDHADRDRLGVRAQHRERRDHGRGARRRLHRDGDYVVDQQRDRRDLGDPRAEVLPRHHVGAARPDVHHHDLAVGQHHERHDEQDDQGHRQDQRERRQPGQRQQRDEDFLGAVGRGGDAVRRQHAERERVGQPLLGELLVDQRPAEQAALDRVPETVRGGGAPPEQVGGRLAYGHEIRFLRSGCSGLHTTSTRRPPPPYLRFTPRDMVRMS